jgi:hypothetical protein
MVLFLASFASLASLSALSFLAPAGANRGILCVSLSTNTNDCGTNLQPKKAACWNHMVSPPPFLRAGHTLIIGVLKYI